MHGIVCLLLLSGVFIIISTGWFLVDRQQNFRVNHPSPRTYLALSSMRYIDQASTSELRQKAANQIIEVRVRDEDIALLVQQRMTQLMHSSGLKSVEEWTFLSAPLRTLLKSLSSAERERVLKTARKIASAVVDKAANADEQTSLIWQQLQRTNLNQAEKNVVFQVVDSTLSPSLERDTEMAQRLRTGVEQQIPPVVREVKLGGFIVQKGEIVTPETAKLLLSQGYPDAAYPWKQLAFVLISVLIWSFWLIWAGLAQEKAKTLTVSDVTYVCMLLVLYWSAQRTFAVWGMDSLAILALTGWLYMTVPPLVAFHVTLGGGLLGFLIAFEGMSSMVAVGCVLSGVAAGVGYFTLREVGNRLSIWRNLFLFGLCLLAATFFLKWGLGLDITWNLLMGNLLLCAFWSSLVIAILPLWETLFEVVSPLRFLELSHPSQPLLKRLQLEAPGTYHHVIMVGTLAEAAADQLKMNGLLVKAGAYYHDIGKLKRPNFFVENQLAGENVHDGMAPALSALVIISHVKDGIEIAEQYKVPRVLHAFIEEHHGTTTLSYFYRKALEQDGDVVEDSFRYPGPRPQSRETALVMLADSVEAAVKARKKPFASAKELTQLVEEVVGVKIMGRQLEDVDFTMSDLAQIKSSFAETLRSMYQSREVKALPSIEQLRARHSAFPKAE
ncbi:MAG: HDIG domain-containing protein [Synergistaceae bacterium]|nr:HDIG domain-containing protein [Synergistaceae bacterium]